MTKSQQSKLKLGTTKTMSLDEIRPYWRNPRKITDEAVNMLRKSIEEFGYQQPIVVDKDNVIIVGHTRYSALRRMKVERVPVLIADDLSPKKVKELRIIDNRTSEYSSWDFETLLKEVGELDSDLMHQFFPDVVSDEEMDDLVESTFSWDDFDGNLDEGEAFSKNTHEFVCPSCFHSWDQEIKMSDIARGHIGGKDED